MANEILFSSMRAVDDFEHGNSRDLEIKHYLYLLNQVSSTILELCNNGQELENFRVKIARSTEIFIRLTISISEKIGIKNNKEMVKFCKSIARLCSTILEIQDQNLTEKFGLLIRTCLIKKLLMQANNHTR